MSVRIMSWVWEECVEVKGADLLVLLAMADWASDDGRNVYPSVPKLASKARISERQAQRILRKLEKLAIIRWVGEHRVGGRRDRVTREYQVVTHG